MGSLLSVANFRKATPKPNSNIELLNPEENWISEKVPSATY